LSWRKYFTPANKSGLLSPISGESPGPTGSKSNYSSYLPDVYTGSPNRIERYLQYDTMDMDSEVNAALDILSEFSTQLNTDNGTPFFIEFMDKASSVEVKLLRDYLQKWCKLQHFETRMFRIFRNTIKYGDSFFIRDPETKKWFYIDPGKVVKIIVNESEGKKPEQYVIRDINPNFTHMVVTQINPSNQNTQPGGTAYVTGGAGARGMTGAYPQQSGTRYSIAQNEFAIESKHVVHLSLSEGLDNNYPFGNSLLESVFKVYKQKELLEDAIIIYRVQRAPERRVFYIDVGNMPSHMAMQFVERVKNEIHQRRIPSSTGGTSSVVDAGYNPMSTNEDYYFPQTCISLDTKIKLLDNRDLTLHEIINEYENGKINYAYTVNQQTHTIEPGKIVWAGVTRKNAEVVEVTLDNGESVVVTPDHRFIMRDGSEKEAGLLEFGDSIMPLYLIDGKTGKHQHADRYLKYIEPATGKSKWVHTMVCPKKQTNTVIHHIDCNSKNNNPDNLIEMDTEEHKELHRKLGSYHMINAWKDQNKRKNILEGIRKFHANASEQDKQMYKNRGKINGINTWKNPESAQKVLQHLKETRKIVSERKTIKFSENTAFRVIELYNQGYNSISKIIKVLKTDTIFQELCLQDNPNMIRDKNRPNYICPTDKTLNKIVNILGYRTWGEFKNNYANNHKVVSVKILSERIDTGDITIESASGSHNFALSVGIFVHNSEGRGSKVDTLPGGTNLGEIDDLRYFTNKLFRALRIPSSYLPTGPDDSASQFNDGRVGTAYIQELRFNKYCQRLQRLIEEEFNVEFKLYLEQNGIIIDSSIFNIRFNPPQNFAAYRLSELDTVRVQTFSSIQEIPYFSKRFLMKRMLGFNEEEINENERLWREENREIGDISPGSQAEMRGMGITASGIQSDMGGGDLAGMEAGAETVEPGAEAGAAPMPTTPAPTPPTPQ
jgi:hypothetical protein